MALAGEQRPEEPGPADPPEPPGVFHPAEKLEKRTCAFCPKGRDYSVLYFAPTKNIAAHENCLLYSSALVECEDNGSFNHDRNFDVESVKKEIQRGKKLKCTVCKERGATVGCDEKRCTKNYHFFCAQSDHAVPLSNHTEGTYKVFCKEHALKLPVITQSGGDSMASDNSTPGMKRKRGRKKCLSAGIHQPEEMANQRLVKQEEPGRHRDAVVRVAFLKKCKEAGLLNDLFEEILGKLHFMQHRLMEETASESDYEKIGTALLDSGLFEDILINFEAGLDNEIHQSKKKQQQLNGEIKLLQDLKQTLGLLQGSQVLDSSLFSASS